MQVNGGGDVLFNDDPTAGGHSHHRRGASQVRHDRSPADSDQRRRRKDGCDRCGEESDARSPACSASISRDRFSRPRKPGVHDPRCFRAPTPRTSQSLTAPRPGRHARHAGARTGAGGFIAAARGGRRARFARPFDGDLCADTSCHGGGLTGFTHLFNAMRPLESREPGPIAAALELPGAWFGMIVDGVHVDPAMLRLALRGLRQPMLVTDAMPPVGGSRILSASERDHFGPRRPMRAGATANWPAPTSPWPTQSVTAWECSAFR